LIVADAFGLSEQAIPVKSFGVLSLEDGVFDTLYRYELTLLLVSILSFLRLGLDKATFVL
jgi:hypothetical protein